MDRIGNIVADVNRYFRDLEKLSITKEEDLKDIKTFYASSMVVFSILNRAIDLGEEIITTFDLGYPTKYREIFDILENAGIISNETARKMRKLIFYRNVIAHEYYRISWKELYDVIQRLTIVKDFVKEIKEFLKSV
jgi:uncharacterized protein YutE (UPF0331/DUF86 family)